MVQALKVFACGTMTLRGTGEKPLRPDPNDKKLLEALSEGVLCQVLNEGMYVSDNAGVSTTVKEQNFNAAIDIDIGTMEVS